MRRESIIGKAAALRMAGIVVGAVMTTAGTTAHAQAQEVDRGAWTVGASAGAWAPMSSLIKAADSFDTRLSSGPAFALEARYRAADPLSVYASGILAFGTIRLGSSIWPDVFGPSDQVLVVGGTGGILLTADDWLGGPIQPTLRLGGGFKGYRFDLDGAENQLRPTADLGIGFRGLGAGPIEVAAEVRYLPSSFDQSRLPTRGIETQDQRQNDLLFSVGFAIRP